MQRRPIPALAYAMQELYVHEPRALKLEHSSYSWSIRCADPQHAKGSFRWLGRIIYL